MANLVDLIHHFSTGASYPQRGKQHTIRTNEIYLSRDLPANHQHATAEVGLGATNDTGRVKCLDFTIEPEGKMEMCAISTRRQSSDIFENPLPNVRFSVWFVCATMQHTLGSSDPQLREHQAGAYLYVVAFNPLAWAKGERGYT